jgi:dTDP-4-amino-4,6-dideoxygalactose transaminase
MNGQARRVRAVDVVMGAEEQEAVQQVLRSGRLVQGEQVAAFEDEFSAIVSGRECVAVNSGTSALHLGLLALGIGPGDEVVVPSFTFAATANAVVRAGATPVFADIDPATFCLDPDAVARALTPATRAVIPVHLYGQPADMAALRDVIAGRPVLLIEDACQAHGAARDGTPAGALGDLAAFSFYATKNMTTGEGGMVVCADPQTARRVRLFRNQGMEQRYRNEVAGLNNRMTDIAGAIGRVQLRKLSFWNDERRRIASRYDAELEGVAVPKVDPSVMHVYHQYTIRTAARDAMVRQLDERGIDAAVYYPVPTHRLPAYALDLDMPATDKAAAEVLSLPIRPGLTEDEVGRVIAAVNGIARAL